MEESSEERVARLALEKYISDKPNDSGLKEVVEQCKPHLTYVEICAQLNIAIADTPKQKKRNYIRPYASPKFFGMSVSAEPDMMPVRQSPLRKRLDYSDCQGDDGNGSEISVNRKIELIAEQRIEEFIKLKSEESGIRTVVNKCKPHFTYLEICEQLAIDVEYEILGVESEELHPLPIDDKPENIKSLELQTLYRVELLQPVSIDQESEQFQGTTVELDSTTLQPVSIDRNLPLKSRVEKCKSSFVTAVFNSINSLDQLLPDTFQDFFYNMLLHTALIADPTKLHTDPDLLLMLYPSNADGIDQLTNFKIRNLCDGLVIDVKRSFLVKPRLKTVEASVMTTQINMKSKTTETGDLLSRSTIGVNTDKLRTHSVSTNTKTIKNNSFGTNTEGKQFVSRSTNIARNEFSSSVGTNTITGIQLADTPPSDLTNKTLHESAAKRLKTETGNVITSMKAHQGSILKDLQAKIKSDTKSNYSRGKDIPNSETLLNRNLSTVASKPIKNSQKNSPDPETRIVQENGSNFDGSPSLQSVTLSKPTVKRSLPKSSFAIEQEQFILTIKADIDRLHSQDENRKALIKMFADNMDCDYSEEGEVFDDNVVPGDYSTFDAETLAKAKMLKSLAK
ncbi:hypothetical protein HDV01_001513 [Terramyces sp. JEL0728]|nr:hypothetical protein HDV01_001513 [Terramyces sp. JEL0728]